MVRLLAIVMASVFVLSACALPWGQKGGSTNQPVAECSADTDCAVGGCSNQLCGKKGEIEKVVTTCEYRDEYSCVRLTNCACVNAKCKWRETLPYQTCVQRIGQ